MKIALCGSLNFAEEMNKIKERLVGMGHEVTLPSSLKELSINNSNDADNLKKNKERYYKIKPAYMKNYFNIIKNNDAILVVNLGKHDIENYIGGNTFAEIIIAWYYGKKIFFLNPIPKDERVSIIVDELEVVKPIYLMVI